MHKKRRTKKNKMRGGFMEDLQSTMNSWGSNLNSLWQKTKDSVSNTFTTSIPTTTTSSTPITTTTTTPNMPILGGKYSRRRHRGGEAPYPGEGTTAKPLTWVGGKRKRHKSKKRHK